MDDDRICVIGAGNGGCAIAAHLASCGVQVHLCDLFPQYLEGIRANGYCIELTENGKTVKCKIAMVTDSVCKAIQGVKLIMVVTPSFTHRLIAKTVASVLRSGQVVVLNPGHTGGALEFSNTIRSEGCTADILVAETQTLVYACRRRGLCSVQIYGTKKRIAVGVIPVNKTSEVLELLHNYYTQFIHASSCLETSLSNIGALFHPIPMLLNLARIETSQEGFLYYWQGISPTVAELIHEIDLERIAVAEAYGVKILSAEEWLQSVYDTHGDTLYELIQNSTPYGEIKAPTTIDARYVTEDVPMSLVPISALAECAGVAVPNIDTIINLANLAYKRDFRSEGRCAENLGIVGMNKGQIIRFFQTGVC